MSNTDPHPAIAVVGGTTVEGPTWEPLTGRDVVLGGTRARGTEGLSVVRTLPNKTRRMVGAWCFVDHFGRPADDPLSGPANGAGMDVPPHPHTGLQTVTWLLEGEVLHRDSLANTQLIRPGQLNLMTAGRAIAHAEVTPEGGPSSLHGVQLWVALPDGSRGVDPHFEHLPELPTIVDGPTRVRVLAGELGGARSPARTYSPLVGAEVRVGGDVSLPLEPDFEYAVLPLTGAATVDGVPVERGVLIYLGRRRHELSLGASRRTSVLLLGGEPFGEKIVMWWNFIGRSHDEIEADRSDWMAGRRFGTVVGYDGSALPAPPMPGVRLMPR